jgi:DNA mismatch endonuclease, patch repair protein
MDTLTPRERSERMSRVRSKDTGPEWTVRRLVYGMGYRYRLHDPTLPGTPDLVFRGRRKVVEVRGCTWHGHEGCGRVPKSRRDFWEAKIRSNRERDAANEEKLRELGWQMMVVWECELKVRDRERLKARLRAFLGGEDAGGSAENTGGDEEGAGIEFG